MNKKLKITPDAPKNESGLAQMITMGKSIPHDTTAKQVLPVAITGSFIISLVIGHKYSSGTPLSVKEKCACA